MPNTICQWRECACIPSYQAVIRWKVISLDLWMGMTKPKKDENLYSDGDKCETEKGHG